LGTSYAAYPWVRPCSSRKAIGALRDALKEFSNAPVPASLSTTTALARMNTAAGTAIAFSRGPFDVAQRGTVATAT